MTSAQPEESVKHDFAPPEKTLETAISFNNVPGPLIFKVVKKYLKYLPIIGTELGAYFLQVSHKAGKFNFFIRFINLSVLCVDLC